MTQTFAKTIRITANQWDRIERAAKESKLSANQFLVELAIEALDRRDWPRTEAEIHVARASMFVALALQRDLIAAGREDEIDEIRQFISTILPEPENEPGPTTPSELRSRRPLIADPDPLGAEHAGQIERIFRGVYVLSTLKRDEMIREGQQEEFERIHKDAHKTQDSIRKDAPGKPE